MKAEQLCEKQTKNVVNISFPILWRKLETPGYLEETLRNMKVDDKLQVFEFNLPYLLRDFDKEINQILDSEVHENRKYAKKTNEQNLTYKIWRIE